MKSAIQLLCLFAVFVTYKASCPGFTWGTNCEYQKCGCDAEDSDTCPGGTFEGLPCCKFCAVDGWNCKCGDGCENTDNCCMYCPSRYLRADEDMKPFFIKQVAGSIVLSNGKGRNYWRAKDLCPEGTEMLFINNAYAEAELEAYLVRFTDLSNINDQYYLDGSAPTELRHLSTNDWKQVVSREQAINNCLVASNTLPGKHNIRNWEVRGHSCMEGPRYALCKNIEVYYGLYYDNLELHRTGRQNAYNAAENDCNDKADPLIEVENEDTMNQLFNELERNGWEREEFFLRGYTNVEGKINVNTDIISGEVDRHRPRGRYCLLYRSYKNGPRAYWEVHGVPCGHRDANSALCATDTGESYVLY